MNSTSRLIHGIWMAAIIAFSLTGIVKGDQLKSTQKNPKYFTNDLIPTAEIVNDLDFIESAKVISAGEFHTCAVTKEGGVKCWGENEHGQLGNGTTDDSTIPVDVIGLTGGVISVSAGYTHTCAVTIEGGVKCWGENLYGMLGDGTTTDHTTPVDVVGLTSGVAAVTSGAITTCALANFGGVRCWGFYVGDGTTNSYSTPVDVNGLSSGVTNVSAGGGHICVVTEVGGVKCWGANYYGELGDGTTTIRTTPVNVSGLLTGVASVSAGSDHTCALMSTGEVKCWGGNSAGQLGDGTTTPRTTPVNVNGLSNGVVMVSAGGGQTCAVTLEGRAMCLGSNYYGQLGDGSTVNSTMPVEVNGLSDGVTSISSGLMHSCVLTTIGGVKCWGYNFSGQLGDGTSSRVSIPVNVRGLTNGVESIGAGKYHACAITDTGGVKCWGKNLYYQLGDGTSYHRSIPIEVSNLSNGIISVSLGSDHTCALTLAGGVKCWGHNNYGQLGDGTTDDHSTPVDVSNLSSGVIAITTGSYHTCALTNLGGVKCWGSNIDGQLGNGSNAHSSTPVDVNTMANGVNSISAGYSHTCAVTTAGAAKCWGDNEYGQLGDNTFTNRLTPTDVSGLSSGIATITTGEYFSCALTVTGGVKCWGDNIVGQLGDETTTNRTSPVDVKNLTSGVTKISTGYAHNCVIKQTGELWCWGGNYFGELGDGTFINRSIPVEIKGVLSGVSLISAGGEFTCAYSSEQGLKCWGSNEFGQIGYKELWIPVDVFGLLGGQWQSLFLPNIQK